MKHDRMNSLQPAPRSPAVHCSSRPEPWSTPQWLFERLNRDCHLTLNP